jgi:hypothetical protein
LEVSLHLLELNTLIRRTADTCRARMKKLVMLYKTEQSRLLQKIGVNEEVDRFIQDMDELVIRLDQGSTDLSVRQEAVTEARALEENGQIVKDASLRGLLRKRDEIWVGGDSGSEVESDCLKKKRKNEAAIKIDEVLDQFNRDDDSTVLQHLQEVEDRHHSELVSGLKSLADELKEYRLARREEYLDMMRVLSHSLGGGSNSQS